MSLTKFTESTNVISQLPDEPTLTSAELKAKFDEAGGKIKTYLNDTLTTETEQLVATEKSSLQTLINNLRTELTALINTKNEASFPVGNIIMSTVNTNPYSYLGFGTWQLWGQGKVPVGVDSEDTDFDEVEKTGGEKTHTLTINEMPSHNHNVHTNASGGGGIQYPPSGQWTNSPSNYNWYTSNAGGNQPHNNLQPYITCYMWKRVS